MKSLLRLGYNFKIVSYFILSRGEGMGKNLVKVRFSRCCGGEMLTSKFSGSGENI